MYQMIDSSCLIGKITVNVEPTPTLLSRRTKHHGKTKHSEYHLRDTDVSQVLSRYVDTIFDFRHPAF